MPEILVPDLVNELFGRSVAGIFAWKPPDQRSKTFQHNEGYWLLHLGLVVRLEHAAASAVYDPEARPDFKQLIGGYPELNTDNLELASTDQLLAELWRKAEGSWVLGLYRLRRTQVGHWAGLCWNGVPQACVSLARMVSHSIELAAIQDRIKRDLPLGSLKEELGKTLSLIPRHLEAENPPSRTWMLGLLRISEAICHARGTPTDDLADFVRID